MGSLGSQSPLPVADGEETEFRLKAIDVTPELRARIRRSIDDGVHWLKARQHEDGSFVFPGSSDYSPGLTALCGLACRHASTKEGRDVGARAAAWVMPKGKDIRADMKKDVYALSLAILLLETTDLDSKTATECAVSLNSAQSPKSGWWGYIPSSPGRKGSKEEFEWMADHDANLSTTQFAALGLGAAKRRGATVDPAIWIRHLDGLARSQSPLGSWAYEPGPDTEFRPYKCGTFMGMANLALCWDAIGESKDLSASLRERARSALEAGKRALVVDGKAFLARLGGMPHIGFEEDVPSFSLRGYQQDYYSLFALEKACIFSATERLGDVPWYATGAELLLKDQNKDGGWGGCREKMGPPPKGEWVRESQSVSTAFALLFLVRMAEACKATTPRPVDFDVREKVSTQGPAPADAIDPAKADAMGDEELRDLFMTTLSSLTRGGVTLEDAAPDFVREGPRVIPLLLRLLEDPDPGCRRTASDTLRRVTVEGPAFDPGGTDETRALQIATWEEWWFKHKPRLERDVAKGAFVDRK